MNRKRVSTQYLLYFLMLMFLVVTVGVGCSKSDDAATTYSVSGTVTLGGAAQSGVTVTLSGDKTATTTTATNGTYSFTGLAVGNYTVTPVKTGYTFSPLSSGGHLTANQTADFTATVNTGLTYSISGTVSGAVLAGVTMTLSGDANGRTVTNASGNYSFAGIALNGNYTVTPSLDGYTFSPISKGVIISGADSTGNNFTATANTATTYSISGKVTGPTIAGVTITLSGGTVGTAITTTDGSGNYSFTGLLVGSYTVTPSLTGYTFSPASRSITLSANSTGNDFASTNASAIYSISGTVSGTTGVTINLTGAATASTTGGVFSFTGLANGTYTVTPVKTGYKFTPASSSVTIAGGNITGTDFSATSTTATTYSISGTVSGEVKSGVTITLSGPGSGTTTTNASGNYSFSGLVAGSYMLTPSLAGGYTIAPTSLSPTISSANVTGQNFVVGTASTFSQADLTGTWYMNNLRADKWMRAQITINSSGVATCNSMKDSGGGTTCPSPFDLTLTMNTSTGVITQTGANAANAGTDHMTMTSTKNLMVGTATNGSSGSYKYQLVILQKMGGTYSTTDVQGKSFVDHQLGVGTVGNNEWRWGTGHTVVGEVWIDSEYTPSGPVPSGDLGALGQTIAVTTSGIVTITKTGGGTSDMDTFEGFLSDDKRTIVGTHNNGGEYQFLIIQIPESGQFTVGSLPASIAYAHMLGGGTGSGSGFAGWIHDTTTVASDGTMTFSDWVDSGFGSSAPGSTYTGNITDTSGTLTITGNDTYNGQISHDKKFIVATQTSNGQYFLNVTTK